MYRTATVFAFATHGASFLKVLQARGYTPDDARARLPALQRAMTAYIEDHLDEPLEGLELLPGVVELLRALGALPGVEVGLVTGNLEPAAWFKMRVLGIEGLFPHRLGGFGSDYCSGDITDGFQVPLYPPPPPGRPTWCGRVGPAPAARGGSDP